MIETCQQLRTAVDIGAHIGATAIAMARYFEQVQCFEVMPETFAVLAKNADDHPNITAHNIGISESYGEVSFEYIRKHSQLTRAVLDGEDKQFGHKSTIVGPFETRPMDSFQLEAVDLIKIDVEGSELEVLKGAAQTIQRCKPQILLEQDGNESKFHGRPIHEASTYLESLGAKRDTDFPFKNDRLFTWA